MGRLFVISISLFLSGCSQLTNWPTLFPEKAQATIPSRYDFAWRLSGDRQVAPLQVFDDGRQMWLQFAANAPVPAIFARNASGDVPLIYERNGPYVVVAGVWPLLVLRGGHLQSVVQRIDDSPSLERADEVEQADEGRVPEGGTVGDAALVLASGRSVDGEPASTNDSPGSTQALSLAKQPLEISVESGDAGGTVPGNQVAPEIESVPLAQSVYAVSPDDKNIRLALKRWANTAGWTFGPAHWTVDVDIPVVGSARFDNDFKQAVQTLMASTELAARPLQACFYSNKVLRVISYTQSCDRTAGRVQAS